MFSCLTSKTHFGIQAAVQVGHTTHFNADSHISRFYKCRHLAADEYVILTYNVGEEGSALTLEEVQVHVEYRSFIKAKTVKAFVAGIAGDASLGVPKTAVQDALAMRDKLTNWGAKVSFCGEHCGITKLARVYRRFLETLRKGDVAIIFLTGHGFELGHKQHLLAKFDPSNATTIDKISLALDTMTAELSQKDTSLNVVLIDCCHQVKDTDLTNKIFGGDIVTSPLNIEATARTIIGFSSSPKSGTDGTSIVGKSGQGQS